MIQLTSDSLQEKMYFVVPRAKCASGKLLVQNLWINDMCFLNILSKMVLWSESCAYAVWNVEVIFSSPPGHRDLCFSRPQLGSLKRECPILMAAFSRMFLQSQAKAGISKDLGNVCSFVWEELSFEETKCASQAAWVSGTKYFLEEEDLQ